MTALAVQQLIADARVPGLSMAVIHDRQATALTAVGVRNSLDRAAVDQQTIFAAASLSKPLFAYAVLQLVDAGKLAFDTPLSLHVPDYVTDDPRAAAVTVRHVLSHTSGLPNWRSVDLPLKTYFPTSSANTLIGVGCPHAPPSCANLHSARRSRRHRLPFPAGSFIEGFRTPATVQAASLRSAGIRNPQHERKCRMCCRSGNVARRCARQ